MTMKIESVFKRDFTKKPFQLEKITDAVLKAMLAVNKGDVKAAEKVSYEIYEVLVGRKKNGPNYVPNVEEIQDLVEEKLMEGKYLDVAKAYILYRNEQAQKRTNKLN